MTVEAVAADLRALCAGLPEISIHVETDGKQWGTLLKVDPGGAVQWGVRAPTPAGLVSALAAEGLSSLRADLDARTTGRPLPARTAVPVVMEPLLAAIAIHECIGHTSEADNFAAYGDRLGLVPGDRWTSLPLEVVDDPTLPGHCGSYEFDDAGVPAQRVVLVEDGRWTGLLTGTNGHGRCAVGATEVLPRMGVFMTSGGTDSPADLIGSMTDGLLLGAPREGGSVREFMMLKPAWARRIRHGRLTGELYTDLVLRGRKTQIMRRLRGIADDPRVADPYHRCAKFGQEVSVSLGAPHLLFDDLFLYPDKI